MCWRVELTLLYMYVATTAVCEFMRKCTWFHIQSNTHKIFIKPLTPPPLPHILSTCQIQHMKRCLSGTGKLLSVNPLLWFFDHLNILVFCFRSTRFIFCWHQHLNLQCQTHRNDSKSEEQEEIVAFILTINAFVLKLITSSIDK